MATDFIDQTWNRVENWLRQNRPNYYSALGDGASESEIQQLEDTVGRRLPEEVRASLRRHNGQDRNQPWVWCGQILMSCKEIASDWSSFKESFDEDDGGWDEDFEGEDGVLQQWWNPGWIPWLSNGGGDFTCIDLAPAEGGTVGQVIDFGHDSGERPLLYPSFTAFLVSFADRLEAGTAYEEYEG